MRQDLADAHVTAWHRLAAPGTWRSGAERVAIAAETRHAASCPLCAARKTALAPLAVAGAHAALGDLDASDVEAIHRIRSDSGRLGEAWFRRVADPELPDGYVELVSIVVVTIAVDSFRAAAGLPLLPLPTPLPGTPSRRRPAGARPGPGFTKSLRPDDASDDDPDLFRVNPSLADGRERRGANIHLALSLVPHAMIHWWDCFEPMYMTGPMMRDWDTEYRAISHAQLEMLAARVAALNQCEY